MIRNFLSPIFSNERCTYYESAKYRTFKKFRIIVDPLFPSFLHHHCLQILYTTNFLRENVFYILFPSFLMADIAKWHAETFVSIADEVHETAQSLSQCALQLHSSS